MIWATSARKTRLKLNVFNSTKKMISVSNNRLAKREFRQEN